MELLHLGVENTIKLRGQYILSAYPRGLLMALISGLTSSPQ